MSTESALRIAGLRAGYGQTPILQGIDLDLKRGEIVSLIGRNGVGKTTILRCLMGQLPAAQGRIDFEGRDITRLANELFALPGRIASRLLGRRPLDMGAGFSLGAAGRPALDKGDCRARGDVGPGVQPEGEAEPDRDDEGRRTGDPLHARAAGPEQLQVRPQCAGAGDGGEDGHRA